jgi:hypothetical protein
MEDITLSAGGIADLFRGCTMLLALIIQARKVIFWDGFLECAVPLNNFGFDTFSRVDKIY